MHRLNNPSYWFIYANKFNKFDKAQIIKYLLTLCQLEKLKGRKNGQHGLKAYLNIQSLKK